jgi:hypothetical protein
MMEFGPPAAWDAAFFRVDGGLPGVPLLVLKQMPEEPEQ